MTTPLPVDPPELERQLRLLEELPALVRQQAHAQQHAAAEARRLHAVVEEAATRLATMLAGQRASRADLQALIDTLRAAIGAAAPPAT